MLLSNTLKYLPAQLLAPLSQFLSIILWTYFGNESLIGYVTLITAFQELAMAMLVNWWMHFSMREYGHFQQPAQQAHYWQNSRVVLTMASGVMLLASALNLYFFVDQHAMPLMYLLVGCFAVLRACNSFNAAMASVRQKIGRYTVLSCCGPFIGLIIGVSLLHVFGVDPLYPILGYVAGETLAAVLVYRIRRCDFINLRLDKALLQQALRYGLPMIAAALGAWLVMQYPRYYIANSISLEQAGIYAVGAGLGLRIASLITMLVTPAALPLLFSRLHAEGLAGAKAQLQDNLVLLCAILLPGLVGLYAVLPILIPLLVEQRFVDGTLLIMPWALLAGGIEAIKNGYLNHYFFIQKATRTIFCYDSLMALLVIALTSLLVTQRGIGGGMLASTLALLVGVGGFIGFLWVKGSIALPLWRLSRVTLATTAMYCTVLFINVGLPLQLLLLKIVVGVTVYSVLLALLFYPELRGYLRHYRLRKA